MADFASLCYSGVFEAQTWPPGPGGAAAVQAGEVSVLPATHADDGGRCDR